jgi:adenylate cyclase
MGISSDLEKEVNTILSQPWSIRDGEVVPEGDTVALVGGGVKLHATMLYADLADSTAIAMWDRRVAARLFKSFLTCCSRVIRARGGYIRSFDGDRVMGVFLGDRKNSSAATCALNISHLVVNIIKPKFEAKYEAFQKGTYQIAHCVGADTSEVLVVRAGIRNNNDLIWVGRGPNVAAKLSSIRNSPYHSYITEDVYNALNDPAKFSIRERLDMWEKRINSTSGVSTIYCSSWTWMP